MSQQVASLPISIFQEGGANDFAYETIVALLDAKSLVRLGATSKTSHSHVKKEMIRRKKQVVECERKIRLLIGVPGDAGEEPPMTRANVLQAQEHKTKAWGIVADGCTNDELEHPSHPFRNELLKFQQRRSPLCMLPLCFYLPPTGEPVDPSQVEPLPGPILRDMDRAAEDVIYRLSVLVSLRFYVTFEQENISAATFEAIRKVARELVAFDDMRLQQWLEDLLEREARVAR